VRTGDELEPAPRRLRRGEWGKCEQYGKGCEGPAHGCLLAEGRARDIRAASKGAAIADTVGRITCGLRARGVAGGDSAPSDERGRQGPIKTLFVTYSVTKSVRLALPVVSCEPAPVPTGAGAVSFLGTSQGGHVRADAARRREVATEWRARRGARG